MRTVPFFVVGAAAAVVLQAACGGWLEACGARPDVALAAVAGAGLLAGWRTGALAGAAAGWCVLALTPEHPWLWLVLYAAAGAATGLVSHPFARESVWWHALMVAAASLAIGLGAWAVGGGVWRPGWLPALYSGLVAPLVFLVVKRLWIYVE